MAEQKIALITGGNRGIGLEICRRLAKLGIRVILGSRNGGKGIAAARELIAAGLPVEARELDVASEESIHGCINWIRRDLGRLDILVNNAGIMVEEGDAEPEQEIQVIRDTMQTNVYGPLLLSRRMSKASINVVTRVLAAKTQGMGILINSVDPGWVQTAMGGSGASRTVQKGAETPVWLATLPDSGPTGSFFRDRKSVAW